MADTYFRKAEEPIEPVEEQVKKPEKEVKPTQIKTDGPVIEKEGVKSPILHMQESPYVAKFLDVEGLLPNLDRETVANMDFVDEYFKHMVDLGKYENDEVGYKEYMKKMLKTVDVEHAPLRTKIGKLAEYIKYMQRSTKYGI